jgi:hypothetical protein
VTAWDVLSEIIKNSPPIAAGLFLLVTGIIFAIGFFRHGVNFIKYGFKQIALDSSLEKRFDKLEDQFNARFAEFDARFVKMEDRFNARFAEIDARFAEIDVRFGKLETKIEAIEVNHFGHLKNYLGILNGVLLDKGIIDNETKARLDNELRGM